ncbi:hypothetical protein N9O56_00555 [Rickettsiales bacterium]|nr:hypothetical protein [Rickettsiales bacterium]
MPSIEVVIIKNENLKNTSFGSFQTCKNVYKSILKRYKNIIMTICNDESDLQKVVDRKPDLVVLTNKIMVDNHEQKIWLSSYFDDHHINYTGSTNEALFYDVNKIASKKQVMSHGIQTARFFTASPGQYKSVSELSIPFPLFIKPISSANSDGIDSNSFITDFLGFKNKVEELYGIYQEPVLVEEYLPGREFTVSIIKTDTMLIAPIEIIAPLQNDIRILSKEMKSKNCEKLVTITDINTYQKVCSIAKASFEALGARDFGRIDIKMDVHERCYFIEANLTPGMTQGSSYFPSSFELGSMLKYDEVIHLITKSAIDRLLPTRLNKTSLKIDKSIEIVMIPGSLKQKNIAINLDENLIFGILSGSYRSVCITVIRNEEDLNNLANRKPDLIFSGVKYFSFKNTNDKSIKTIWLNDFLDKQNISYIGSDREALEGEYDKCYAKEVVKKSNISTANFFTAKPGEYKNIKSIPLTFPLFIKPIGGGDSRGIDSNSVVHNFKEYQSKVSDIYQNQQESSLVETYLSGNEYSVSIFEDIENNKLIAMPIQITPAKNKDGNRILDFDTKINNSEKINFVTDPKIHAQLSALAITAFRALGGRIFGRIDIKMDAKNFPHFIEANFMPGLSMGYFYRACLLNKNMSHEAMILKIAYIALSRGAQ